MNEQITEWLRYLTAGGAVAVVGWFASWFLEDFAFWQNAHPKVKMLVILAVSILLGMGAVFVLGLPPEVLAKWEPYLGAAFIIVTTWLGTQIAHRKNPQRTERAEKAWVECYKNKEQEMPY
jgi:uncharacterized membrane protein YfcA